MSLVPGSLDKEVRISPTTRRLIWQGTLTPGEERQISYQAIAGESVPAGTRLVNRVTIYNLDKKSSFRRELPLWIDSPDLSESTLTSSATADLPERSVTYTLALRNRALFAAREVTAVLHLPASLNLLTNTLYTTAGEAEIVDQQVIWNGALDGGGAITTTIALTQAALSESWLPAAAIVEDGLTDPLILPDLRYLPPKQIFFPLFAIP